MRESLFAVYENDTNEVYGLTAEYQRYFEFAAILMERLGHEWTQLSEFHQGYDLGKVIFEVASMFTPAVVAKAGKVENLAKLPSIAELAATTGRRLEGGSDFFSRCATICFQLAEDLATTRMCFVAGTPVHTDHGTVPIETIRAGDMVLSRNEHDPSRQAYKRVADTFETHPEAIHHITYSLRGPPGGTEKRETLATTAQHPFYVIGRASPGFVEAGDLREGDTLSLADSGTAVVVSNQLEHAAPGRTFTTYNFEVEDYHTYFVGKAGVWVHNEGAWCQKLFAAFERFMVKRFSGNLWAAYRHVLTGPSRWFSRLPDRWKLRLFNEVRRRHFASPGALIPDWRDLTKQTRTPIPSGSTMPPGWNNSRMAKELADNVQSALGVDRPDFPADLHHLIPHTADTPSGSGAKLRALLSSKGIHPNEACNGVYLPRTQAVADLHPDYGPRHRSLHPDAFLDKIWDRLNGHSGLGPNEFRDEMQRLAADIIDGTFAI